METSIAEDVCQDGKTCRHARYSINLPCITNTLPNLKPSHYLVTNTYHYKKPDSTIMRILIILRTKFKSSQLLLKELLHTGTH